MDAIVYTSNTGHTAAYAKLLGESTGLPVYTLAEAVKTLKPGTSILYMGWLKVGSVVGYKQAVKKYDVRAVCGVGLCTTGALLDEVRKAISLPESSPVFTLQGGLDLEKLRGMNKFMIQMLTKMMSKKTDRTEGEEQMLALLLAQGNYVCKENLSDVLTWWNKTM